MRSWYNPRGRVTPTSLLVGSTRNALSLARGAGAQEDQQMQIGGGGHHELNPPTTGGFGNSLLLGEAASSDGSHLPPETDYLPGGGGQYEPAPEESYLPGGDGQYEPAPEESYLPGGEQEVQIGGGGFQDLNPPGGAMLYDEPAATPSDPPAEEVPEIPSSGGFGDSLIGDIAYGPEGPEQGDAYPPEGEELDQDMMMPGTKPAGVSYHLGIKDRDTGGTHYSNAGQFGASLNRRHGFGQGVMYV